MSGSLYIFNTLFCKNGITNYKYIYYLLIVYNYLIKKKSSQKRIYIVTHLISYCMDIISHILFAKVLLTKSGKDPLYSQWSITPDDDLYDGTLLHRYRTHRISSLPNVYINHSGYLTADKDAIALAFISHLYLDIFNGFVIPFEIYNPVWQMPKMFWFMIGNPIKNIFSMSAPVLPQQYYDESEIISNKYSFGNTIEDITSTFIHKLTQYAGVPLCNGIEPIVQFTGNTNYRQSIETDTTLFEEEYSNHIIKYLSL